MVKDNLNVGDIVLIPVGDGRAHVAQSVGRWRGNDHYFAVFDPVMSLEGAHEDWSAVVKKPIKIVGLAGSERVRRGHWPKVGSAAVPPDVPLPVYKEGSMRSDGQHEFYVVDHSGERRRPATPAEASVLGNQITMQPGYLEWVLKASLGLEPWNDRFDRLLPENTVTSEKLSLDGNSDPS